MSSSHSIPRGASSEPSAKRQRLLDATGSLHQESPLLLQCLRYEHELDQLLERRHSQLIDTVYSRPKRTETTLRITFYNTFASQEPCYVGADVSAELIPPASWSLFIEGCVDSTLERNNAPSSPTSFVTTSSNTARPTVPVGDRKLSSFFSSIIIQLTPLPSSSSSSSFQSETVEWKIDEDAPVDGFELKRLGRVEQSVKVLLYPRYLPPRYQITHAGLSRLLCIEADTKSRVLLYLWHYIKTHNLLSRDEPHLIACDSALRDVFGCDTVPVLSLPDRLQPHFGPLQPIELEYRVALSGDPVKNAATYEIVLDVPSTEPAQNNVPGRGFKMALHELDSSLDQIFDQLAKTRHRYQMFSALQQSPVRFLKDFLHAQMTAYKLAHADDGFVLDAERRSEFFDQPFISEAIQMYLHALE